MIFFFRRIDCVLVAGAFVVGFVIGVFDTAAIVVVVVFVAAVFVVVVVVK